LNYKAKLIELFESSKKGKSFKKYLPEDVLNNIEIIADNSNSQKGVFTVLITLNVYKILHPTQDIRIHQS